MQEERGLCAENININMVGQCFTVRYKSHKHYITYSSLQCSEVNFYGAPTHFHTTKCVVQLQTLNAAYVHFQMNVKKINKCEWLFMSDELNRFESIGQFSKASAQLL